MPFVVIAFVVLAGCAAAADLKYWIEPCTKPATGCLKDDPQLAEWALKAWESSSGGTLHLERARQKGDAQIRIHWVDGNSGLYGEAQPIMVDGTRTANIADIARFMTGKLKSIEFQNIATANDAVAIELSSTTLLNAASANDANQQHQSATKSM